MTRVDQFESIFRAAARERFKYSRPSFDKITVVTDLVGDRAQGFLEQVQRFLSVLQTDSLSWELLDGGKISSPAALFEPIRSSAPALVCTYRSLYSDTRELPYSLGEAVEILTQATDSPVLLLPHPEVGDGMTSVINTDRVMCITSHLVGDHRLVNAGFRFTEGGGKLLLTHIEDRSSFDRVIDAVSKIPEIDTEEVHEVLHDHYLEEAGDYIDSCAAVLAEADVSIEIEKIVGFGDHVAEILRLIGDHEIDLLLMNTKDEDQLAMHGLAYPLAIELRKTPLLLL